MTIDQQRNAYSGRSDRGTPSSEGRDTYEPATFFSSAWSGIERGSGSEMASRSSHLMKAISFEEVHEVPDVAATRKFGRISPGKSQLDLSM
jgi:hypothetical protein